jgi:hypothetical protein
MDPLIEELFDYVIAYELLRCGSWEGPVKFQGCKTQQEVDEKVLWLTFSEDVDPSTIKVYDLKSLKRGSPLP